MGKERKSATEIDHFNYQVESKFRRTCHVQGVKTSQKQVKILWNEIYSSVCV